MRCSSWLDIWLKTSPNCENSSLPRTGRRWSKRPEATARMPSANARSVCVSERTASVAPAPMRTSSRPMSSATRKLDLVRVGVELVLRVEGDRLAGPIPILRAAAR